MEEYLYQDLFVLEEHHWWHQAKRQLVLEAMRRFSKPKTKKLKILDLGCGTGKNVEVFQQFADAYGVDVSKAALRFCKKRGIKNIKLANAEGKLPFKSGTFDAVTMLDVLEHIKEGPALDEVYRVLKNNGVLYVTVPAFQWLWSDWDKVLHHHRRYTKKSLAKVLQKHHLNVQFSSYVYSFLVLPALIIRTIKSARKSASAQYESDFKIGSPFINTVFRFAATAERKLLWLTTVPFGTSVFISARKRRDG